MNAPRKEANDFYVYLYADPWTGDPLYVGRGRDFRAFDHLSYSHNKHLREFIALAKREGVDMHPTLLAENLSHAKSVELEIKKIREYGRADLGKGTLLNRVTSHGENSKKNPITLNGVTYRSLAEADRAHGLAVTTIAGRLARGWTIAQIEGKEAPPPLTPPTPPRKAVIVSGLFFESMTAACLHFCVDRHVVKMRLKVGKTTEEAFFTPVKHPKNPRQKRTSSSPPPTDRSS